MPDFKAFWQPSDAAAFRQADVFITSNRLGVTSQQHSACDSDDSLTQGGFPDLPKHLYRTA